MDRYKVAFDGEWRAKFGDLDEALEWAHEVAETGRLVFVVEAGIARTPKLVAILPEGRAEEGERLWRMRDTSGGGGGGGPLFFAAC